MASPVVSRRSEGPDRGYSWVIALCCSYMHFALFGLFRSAGVVYVAMIDIFQVPREDAAWPFSICAGMFQLIAPTTSFLAMYLSLRQIALLGSSIATVGIAVCYFATSITWINIWYGVVHGMGFGITTTLIPVTINLYFIKHKATAMGIAFAGGSLSSMLFPIVMEWLLHTYTLNDSFLLLSGVVMNTLVAASLLRTPPWLEKAKDEPLLIRDVSEGKDSGLSISADQAQALAFETKAIDYSSRPENVVENEESFTEKTDLPYDSKDNTVFSNDSVLFGGSNNKINVVINMDAEPQHPNIGSGKNDDVHKPLMSSGKIFIVPSKKEPSKTMDVIDDAHETKGFLQSLISILTHPMFLLITFTMSVFFLATHSFFIVVVDFSKDKGIAETSAVYIISMFSVTDMFGRAGLGWVTDRNFMKRKSLITLNLATVGVVCNLYPMVTSLTGMLLVAALHGIAVGSSITIFFVIMAESLGTERLPLVVGMNSFINGIMSFSRPFLIGLFRDIVGSYNLMFRFNGTLLLIFASAWLFQICSEKRRELPSEEQNQKTSNA